MDQSQKCCKCDLPFTVDRLPHLLECQHSICEQCIKEFNDQKQQFFVCLTCQKSIPAAQLIDLPFNQNARLHLQQQVCVNNKEKANEGEEQKNEFYLLDVLNEMHVNNGNGSEFCEVHQVLKDIICITEKIKICPHCALFGSHKHHIFKRIEDFQKQIQEKQQMFSEILVQKQNSQPFKNHCDLSKAVQEVLEEKRQLLVNQLGVKMQLAVNQLKAKQEQIRQEIQKYFQELHTKFQQGNIVKLGQMKSKFESWEQQCQENIDRLAKVSQVEEKINLYFNGPLEIVSEGYIYLEQYHLNHQHLFSQLQEKIKTSLTSQQDIVSSIDHLMALTKTKPSPLHSPKDNNNQEPSDSNPFLDCTSSDIYVQSISHPQNNNSIVAEITSLTTSPKAQLLMSEKNIDSHCKGFQNKDKGQINAYRRKTMTFNSPKMGNLREGRASETINIRSSQKLGKSGVGKGIVLQTDQKRYDLKGPDQIFADFIKNKLTDFFDLSDCNLPNDKIVDYVGRARKSHKIKGLKLCSNNLEVSGFQSMIEFLKGVSNINLAGNQINQSIFQVILRHQDQLDLLRVLNLSHNPINLQRKSKHKLQQLKKKGVIIIL